MPKLAHLSPVAIAALLLCAPLADATAAASSGGGSSASSGGGRSSSSSRGASPGAAPGSRMTSPSSRGATRVAPSTQQQQGARQPEIGTPMQSPTALPPQSQPLQTEQATSGGSARTDSPLALSPGSGGSSGGTTTGNEANPSRPGGGGKTLADCMAFWEPATHMSKQEWRVACQRTLREDPSVGRR